MLCVQMLRLTRYMPMPWTRIALHAARASQSSPMPKMITSGAALPLDLIRHPHASPITTTPHNTTLFLKETEAAVHVTSLEGREGVTTSC